MIVGLHGRGRAGNSQAAAYLVEYHGFTRYSFADPIRDVLLAVNPIMPAGGERLRPLINEYGWTRSRNHAVIGPQIKRMMNACGSQLRETFGRDLLLRHFDDWMDAEFGVSKASARVVVTDVNLDTEAMWLRDRGATIVELTRGEGSTGSDETDRGIHPDLIDQVVSVAPRDSLEVIGRAVSVAVGLERDTTSTVVPLRATDRKD